MKWIPAILALFLFAQLCLGASIHVPLDQPTIQAGIDAADVDDTVLVADNTYTGTGNRDIDFGGKAVILMSENGPEVTIIDCQASAGDAHWAFNFHSGEGQTAIVDGFTITHAFTDEQGAIYMLSSSPTIRNCIITDNDCSGIRIEGYENFPKIIECEISANTGHGVSVSNVLWPMAGIDMSKCTVSGNGLSGLQLFSASDVTVTNCTFASNGDAGIHIEGDPPKGGGTRDFTREINNCISAFNAGPGIRRVFVDSPYMFYCNDSYGNDGGFFCLMWSCNCL